MRRSFTFALMLDILPKEGNMRSRLQAVLVMGLFLSQGVMAFRASAQPRQLPKKNNMAKQTIARLSATLRTNLAIQKRRQAAEGLGKLGDRRALPVLLGALDTEPEGPVRLAVIAALAMLGGEEAAGRLARAAREDKDSAVRKAASRALADLSKRQARKGPDEPGIGPATRGGDKVHVVVITEPDGATVQVDKQPQQRSPAVFGDLGPGAHLLVVTRKGYLKVTQTFNIEGTRAPAIKIKLQRGGEVRLRCKTPGATYSVNGEVRGPLPATVSLPGGQYTISVRCPGCETQRKRVKLEAGKRLVLTFSPPPLSGRLRLEGAPPDIELRLAGEKLRRTGDGTYLVPPGKHTLRIQGRGYHPMELRNVQVEVGKEVSFSLEGKVASFGLVAFKGDRGEVTSFTVDGVPGRRADLNRGKLVLSPGRHQVVLRRRFYQPSSHTVEVSRLQPAKIELRWSPLPGLAEYRRKRLWGWTAAAAGGALAVGAVVLGGVSAGMSSDANEIYERYYNSPHSTEAERGAALDKAEMARKLKWTAIGLGAAAVVGAGVSIYCFLTMPKDSVKQGALPVGIPTVAVGRRFVGLVWGGSLQGP